MILRIVLCVAMLQLAHVQGQGPDMIDPLGSLFGEGGPMLNIQVSPEQKALNELCASKCNVEKCYLKDDSECGNYIMCNGQGRPGLYRGTVRPCAFGTYWAGLALQQKITCDLPQNVVCRNQKCGPNVQTGQRFGYDWNCRGYWECGLKGIEPHCCSDDKVFDPRSGECILPRGKPCFDRCPIKRDECLTSGTTTAPFNDGNCRTYWDCEDRRPHPVCCPTGQAYNDTIKGCLPTAACNADCRPEYLPDICEKQNTFKLHDDYCRTYMRCNAVEGDERWCCKSGDYYDSMDNLCKTKPFDSMMNCTDECPTNYNTELDCNLSPFPEDPAKYIVNDHGREVIMECAPGSHFIESACGCGKIVKGASDNSCNMELDILFDGVTWIRSGSQKSILISENGTPREGKTVINRKSRLFDGQLFYRANFFQQSMPKLYMHLVYLPGMTGVGEKQSLVSNCAMLEGGTPSLELALENNRIVLSLVASSNANPNVANQPTIVGVEYTADDWNQATIVYDGSNVELLNQGPISKGYDTAPLEGNIKVAVEGLDFGGCMDMSSMFQGSLAKLQISKCLKQPWFTAFDTATAEFKTTPV